MQPHVGQQPQAAGRRPIGGLAPGLQTERAGGELPARREDRRAARRQTEPAQEEGGDGEVPVMKAVEQQEIVRYFAQDLR